MHTHTFRPMGPTNKYEVHCTPDVVIIVGAILNNCDDSFGCNHYRHNSAMYNIVLVNRLAYSLEHSRINVSSTGYIGPR